MRKRARICKVKGVVAEVLQDIEPSKHELDILNGLTNKLILLLQEGLGKQKIPASAFIGGSLAKNTLLKREEYDIDIFVRFSFAGYAKKDYELSDILEKVLKKVFSKFRRSKENSNCKLERVHGSRDYFWIRLYNKKIKLPILFEIVPVLAISNPREAKNVTDLSFFHINWVKKKISKKPALQQDVLLAKAFCFAQDCYGAESHICGFSGYALELLAIYSGGFVNLVESEGLWKKKFAGGKKVIIDIAKHYKKNEDVLLELNEAKLISPLILIDPTYAVRNVTAALSDETFLRFLGACKNFQKKPSARFFRKQEVEIKTLKRNAVKRKAEFAVLEAKTSKAREDISAAKLLKFFDFLLYLLGKNDFRIVWKESRFEKQQGKLFLIYKKPSGKLLVEGPPAGLKEHVARFRKKHKNIFLKSGKTYAREKREMRDIKDMLSYLKRSSEMKNMDIGKARILRL